MKAARKKSPYPKGKTDQVYSRSIHRNLAGQKGVAGYFNVLNWKNMQPRILNPARLSFKIEGEIKSFPNMSQKQTHRPME